MLTPPKTLDRCLCATAHVLTLATMACFVFFIEKTILVADVSGVHTTRTTGQLIPFIIGVFSLAVALRDTMMLLLCKVS